MNGVVVTWFPKRGVPSTRDFAPPHYIERRSSRAFSINLDLPKELPGLPMADDWVSCPLECWRISPRARMSTSRTGEHPRGTEIDEIENLRRRGRGGITVTQTDHAGVADEDDGNRMASTNRAGWPWVLPPRAPTDPDVRTLPHPVPRPTDSPSRVVPVAIRPSDGDMLIEPRCVRHVSLDRVCRPTLRFPPQGPPGQVPLLQRYYQSATTSCRPSRRTSFPSLGNTSVSLVVFAPWRTSALPRPGSWSPGSSSREFAEETAGPPKFLGNLDHPFAVFQTDAGRTAGTRP